MGPRPWPSALPTCALFCVSLLRHSLAWTTSAWRREAYLTKRMAGSLLYPQTSQQRHFLKIASAALCAAAPERCASAVDRHQLDHANSRHSHHGHNGFRELLEASMPTPTPEGMISWGSNRCLGFQINLRLTPHHIEWCPRKKRYGHSAPNNKAAPPTSELPTCQPSYG
jgi:hypothetical protein